MVIADSQALWSFQNCVMEDLTRGEKTKDWKIRVVDSAGSGMALSALCTVLYYLNARCTQSSHGNGENTNHQTGLECSL